MANTFPLSIRFVLKGRRSKAEIAIDTNKRSDEAGLKLGLGKGRWELDQVSFEQDHLTVYLKEM